MTAMNPQPTLAVFDTMGTTICDDGIVQRCVTRALTSVHMTRINSDDVDAQRGRTKQDLFLNLLGDQVRAHSAFQTFKGELIKAVRQGELQPVASANDVFKAMHNRGINIALISGLDREILDALIADMGWNHTFNFTLSSNDVKRGRPSPDLILTAALQAQVDNVRDILTVGDTTNDLIAADHAGVVMNYGVLGGAHGRSKLESAPHRAILNDLSELL